MKKKNGQFVFFSGHFKAQGGYSLPLSAFLLSFLNFFYSFFLMSYWPCLDPRFLFIFKFFFNLQDKVFTEVLRFLNFITPPPKPNQALVFFSTIIKRELEPFTVIRKKKAYFLETSNSKKKPIISSLREGFPKKKTFSEKVSCPR